MNNRDRDSAAAAFAKVADRLAAASDIALENAKRNAPGTEAAYQAGALDAVVHQEAHAIRALIKCYLTAPDPKPRGEEWSQVTADLITDLRDLLRICEAAGGAVSPPSVVALCAVVRKQSGIIGDLAAIVDSGVVPPGALSVLADRMADARRVAVPYPPTGDRT